ncbi:MAG: hypothetical protein BMS9Abin31_0482 [Gammaproteobacteria bacterium]|nr:MAG: hypothetical protein BMS9Abin31_0482 [Gammaproteobacteria bacterium]
MKEFLIKLLEMTRGDTAFYGFLFALSVVAVIVGGLYPIVSVACFILLVLSVIKKRR